MKVLRKSDQLSLAASDDKIPSALVWKISALMLALSRSTMPMQTPQIFERALIEEAYRAVFADEVSVTDEVSAVERLGRKVFLVSTDDFNFKITYPRDLALAEFVLKQRMH